PLFLVVVTLNSRNLSTVLFASAQLHGLVLPGSIFIVSECLFEFVVLGFLRADGMISICASYYAAKNLTRLVLLGYIAAKGIVHSLVVLLVANIFLTCIVYVLHIAPSLRSSSSKNLERGFWRRLMVYSLPIVVSSNFSWANVSLNRFLIVHFLGLAELSVYAVNYSIASIAHFVAMVVTFTFIPRMNTAWNLNDKAGVRRLLKMATEYYLFAALPIGLAVSLFYPQLLEM